MSQPRPGRSPQRPPTGSPQRPPSRSPQRPPQAQGGQPAGTGGQKSVLYLFDRPSEPSFLPKSDENAIFNVPDEYLTDEFRPSREGYINRIQDNITENVPVRKITLPDISSILKLDRRDKFSLFIPFHRKLAGRLIDIFMGMRNYEDLVSAGVYCRDRVNPNLFIYALSVALLHRPDTRNVNLPPLSETFPDKYVDGAIFKRAREVSNIIDVDKRTPLEIPRDYTASDTDPEHKVAYFREDLGINLHHWHWHLVYPFDADLRIVNKDRRGELFYYMHEQIMARFNFERLCNGMARVDRLSTFRDPIPQGYFSKLDSLVSSRAWPPRHANAVLNDVSREIDQIKFDLSDLERWRDRLLTAISSGFYVDETGRNVPLDETTGIDVLGNLMEASILSKNRNLYGDFHNLGHVAIALCHDPDARHLETFSVMGDPATAMRDPVFYRFHAYIDYLFQQHKVTLPRYTVQQLEFQGVKIAGLEVLVKGRNKNEFATQWEKSDVDLSRGMDFTPRGNVFARFTHLQHAPFVYRIMVENNGQPRMGTCRIFLAPKFDERGLPWLFDDQRLMFVELDRFTVNLKNKQNTIERKSTESSVTIPFEQTFRNLTRNRPTDGNNLDNFNMCGCGWPQHMLLPRGSPEGFPCTLFAMISNYENDKVDQTGQGGPQCDDASSYCGIRNQKYPDKRAMGFPFDRIARDGVDTLRQFLTPNMIQLDARIFHNNVTSVRNN